MLWTVSHDGCWVMVWAGISYGQGTQLHFIDVNWMHRDTLPRSWGPLLCHSSTAINSGPICTQFLEAHLYTIPGSSSVHNSWKLNMSQFFHGLHAHQPVSMFGMLWIDMYDSLFQFPPVSNNFAHSHWRVGQHSTDQNQLPDQLHAKAMSRWSWNTQSWKGRGACLGIQVWNVDNSACFLGWL
jgi:hypothetical protein